MPHRQTRRVELVSRQGNPSVYISAEITASGDLLLSGQDTGSAVSAIWGDSDYEYWLSVPASATGAALRALLESQDSLAAFDTVPESQRAVALLELVEAAYAGDPSVVTKLKALLDEHGIECHFTSYA
jgi:hypothetical protein